MRGADERSAFVGGACGGDKELATEVNSLLAAHDAATPNFLASPAITPSQSPTWPLESGTPIESGARLGPYEVIAAIGAGGMGQVYRALDSRLDRDVAIKVLPAHLSASASALARFEREAKAVAALSHPNILAIHDFGTEGGVSFAVMELLDGRTLRAMLDEGPLPEAQSIDFAVQLAKGLAAAHEQGIVHRDLKPENIFISRDEHLKILDFGLAKRRGREDEHEATASPPRAEGRTQPGTVMGTLGYMSPEQVNGQEVDRRSDIFSFGAILYEMLSGRRAFRKETPADTMAAILLEKPAGPVETKGRRSAALNQIVARCLDKDREQRYGSVREVFQALSEVSSLERPGRIARGALIAAATLIAVAIAAGIGVTRRPTRVEKPGPKRIAVLPFENLGAPEDDGFADGISDAIRGKLTLLSGVQVIARGSSTPYKKTTKTPQQIARELDVGYLLTATVRWQKGSGGADRVEVEPELIEVSTSGAPTSKWQQPFDVSKTDVFRVHSDVATKVAQELGVALGAGQQRRLTERPTLSLAAYDVFLKGQGAWDGWTNNPLSNVRIALGYYEQAVALDPSFVDAWGLISRAYTVMFSVTHKAETAEHARLAAEKAVALAGDRPEGYLALGLYQHFVTLDFSRARAEYGRGLRLAPNNPDLVSGMAMTEICLGRPEEAVGHFKEAERLDPHDPTNPQAVGSTLLSLKRYREAREAFDRGLILAPASLYLLELKALSFVMQGDINGARAVLKTVPRELEPALVNHMAQECELIWLLDDDQRELLLRLPPSAFDDNRGAWGLGLAQASALKGDRANCLFYADQARKALVEELRAAPKSIDGTGHARLGLALAYLGNKEGAIQEGTRAVTVLPLSRDAWGGAVMQGALVHIYILTGEQEKALDQLEPLLKIPYFLTPEWLKIDPNFEPLRENPRFKKLIAGA